MTKMIRIISQIYDSKTGEVEIQKTLHYEKLRPPKTINILGYNHKTQIEILQEAQNFKLAQQEKLINLYDVCPKCGKQVMKQGKFKSSFHAVLTDHKLEIQRKACTCGWQSPYTIEGIYGSSIHPDLLERQSVLGAKHSFRHAEAILTNESCKHRSINNDDRIKRSVALVGECFESIKKDKSWIENAPEKQSLIINVDGGHLHSNEEKKRSFEAMVATIYDPDAVKVIDKHHRKIINKTSVASAKKDDQETMKRLVLNASKKQGMTKDTIITALSDGAKNCWSIIDELSEHCKTVVKILDWFHIGKKFTTKRHCIPETNLELYDKIKWHLWHGHADTSLRRLNQLKALLSDNKKAVEALNNIEVYINNNKEHIVNYHTRRLKNKIYTSNVAEGSVNSLINERQKQNQKMQWSRNGAHAILQLRTSIFSDDWKKDWATAIKSLYKAAA